MSLIKQSLKVPLNSKQKENNRQAYENSVSALGKMLQNVRFNEEDFVIWLGNMPIVEDKQEAKLMNEFLANLLTK